MLKEPIFILSLEPLLVITMMGEEKERAKQLPMVRATAKIGLLEVKGEKVTTDGKMTRVSHSCAYKVLPMGWTAREP